MAGAPTEQVFQAPTAPGRRRQSIWAGCWHTLKRAAAVIVLLSVMTALQTLTVKQVHIQLPEGQTRVIYTAASRVSMALAMVGVDLYEGDRVIPPPGERLDNGDVIKIMRAFPVQISVDGKLLQVRTTEAPVIDILRQAGVVLGDEDKVSPPPNRLITQETLIEVARVTHQYETMEEPLAFTTEIRYDPNLEKGQSQVMQEGVPGVVQRLIKVTYEDGVMVRKTIAESKVIREPVNKIVVHGMKVVPRTLVTASGKVLRYTRVYDMEATAYEPSPRSTGIWSDGYTYTGVRATKGVAAVDPRVIPLGTRLYIPGYGEALAADIGGAIKGYKIDLCYDTVPEALEWGRKWVKVYILAD